MQPSIFKTLRRMPRLIGLLLLVVSLSACKDFFEKNLEEQSITLITPANNAISTNLNITFDWEDVDGATNYRMLIGCPSLNNPSTLYIDSSLTLSTVQYSLSPGEYEWKVRAENNSSETNYSPTMRLVIDSSFNLSSQTIILYDPINNTYTNNNNFSFTWQDLYAAENYQLTLKSGTNWNTGTIFLDTNLTTTQLANPINLPEGKYSWSVKGINNLPSETNYTSKFLINIDLTSPNRPNLGLPDASTGNLYSDSIYEFTWSRAANNGTVQSTLFDSIFIYSDTIQNPTGRYGSLQQDTSLTLPNNSGTYYWTVITYDAAGNQSTQPYFQSFIVL
jgi:hypothetical protein